MNTSALVLMIATWTVVIGFTVYFFYKVLTGKNQDEPDSYTGNDEET